MNPFELLPINLGKVGGGFSGLFFVRVIDMRFGVRRSAA